MQCPLCTLPDVACLLLIKMERKAIAGQSLMGGQNLNAERDILGMKWLRM